VGLTRDSIQAHIMCESLIPLFAELGS
jgi:hypothetical protein